MPIIKPIVATLIGKYLFPNVLIILSAMISDPPVEERISPSNVPKNIMRPIHFRVSPKPFKRLWVTFSTVLPVESPRIKPVINRAGMGWTLNFVTANISSSILPSKIRIEYTFDWIFTNLE